MDTNLITAIVAIATAVGGFTTGRRSVGRDAFAVANSTVELLETQISALHIDREHRDAELMQLRQRVTVLESLVTQRAEVEELSDKVSLVKDTVDRIAIKVGA